MEPSYEIPAGLKEKMAGKSSDEESVLLSTHRTGLSTHRTELSERRTALSILRTHLSNERTHLSNFRTALSFVTLGITINRFSVYLQQNHALPEGRGFLVDVEHAGVGMVGLGIAFILFSFYRFRKVQREILEARSELPGNSILAVSAIFVLLAAGGVLWMILA